MKEPNLNPWYKLWVRWLDRKAREIFFSFDTPIRRRLWDERRRVCNPYPPREMTEQEKERHAEINRTLGLHSIYHFTPEQAERQRLLAIEIVEGLRKEGRIPPKQT